MHPEDLWTEVATYIYEAYDLDSVENIYIAGDGARWIKTGTEIIKGSKYVKILTAHLGSLDNPIYIDEPLWNYMKAGNKKIQWKS